MRIAKKAALVLVIVLVGLYSRLLLKSASPLADVTQNVKSISGSWKRIPKLQSMLHQISTFLQQKLSMHS